VHESMALVEFPVKNEEMKICEECRLEKPREEFYKVPKNSDGLAGYCLECHRIKRQLYQKKYVKALEEERAELLDQSNELKVCFICKKEKPKKEFGKWKKSKDGYDYRCKICKRKFTNNWSKNKKKKVEENIANLPDPRKVLKICIICNAKKPLSEFRKCTTSWNGRYNFCQECDNKYNRKLRKKLIIKFEEERSLLPDQSELPKFCRICKETKPRKEFHNKSSSKEGKNNVCNICQNKYTLKKQKESIELAEKQRALLPDQSEVPKVCSRCGETKSTKEFVSDQRTLDGKAGYCLDCNNEKFAERRANPVKKERRKNRINGKYQLDEPGDKQGKTHLKQKKLERKRKNLPLSRARDIRSSMKSNARKKGFEFNEYYTVEKILKMLQKSDSCPSCDKKFDFWYYDDDKKHPCAPGADRFDSKLGYVKGNVNIICGRCNKIKNNGTDEEFFAIYRWMDEFDQKRKRPK